MNQNQKWLEFWNHQTTPLHRHNTDEHFQQYGAELRILFGNTPLQDVLEIGCGNGAMYPFLGFDKSSYTGVDYSRSMLDDFQRKFPGANLVCGDGAAYRDDKKYDLIFSNGVIQYFDPRMLRTHMESSAAMLKPHGLFIMASVPWRALALEWYRGGAIGGRYDVAPRSRLFASLMWLLRRGRNDKMGYWRTLHEISQLAVACRMVPEFYGSMHYMYRFHVVMRHANA